MDADSRKKTTTLCFSQKKFKRVGPALDTPGFVGKADGYSLFVAHIHVPNGDTKAEIASQGFCNQGGFIVCLAPDDTKTREQMRLTRTPGPLLDTWLTFSKRWVPAR